MLDTGAQLAHRFATLRNSRGNWEDSWQEIADHMTGHNVAFSGEREPGRKRFRRIYDTTGLNAGNFLAGALHGMLTNPASRWFHMRTEDELLMQSEAVKSWLEHVDLKLQRIFRRREFGFLTALAETYTQLAFYGTADLYVEDAPGFGLRYFTRPLAEIFIDEMYTGRIDIVYRRYKMTMRNIVDQFGEDSIPDNLVRLAKEQPHSHKELLHVIHPREMGGPKSPLPWRSVYLLVEGEKIVGEGGYWSMPHQVARWEKDSGEIYGRGPAWVAISDQNMLNEMSKLIIKAGQRQLDPPLGVPDDGVIGDVDLSPGGITVFQSYFQDRQPIFPLLPQIDRSVITEQLIAQRQQMVNRAFMMDLIASKSDPRMTATQVLEVDEQIARLMVPMLGRVQAELVEPLLMRTLDIAERGGLVARRPDELLNQEVRPHFYSPLERIQREAEARSIIGTWTAAAQIGATNPEVFDNYDPDTSARIIAESSSAPPSVLRSIEEREEIRETRAARQQQEEAQEQFAQGTDQAAKLLPAVAQLQKAQAA